MNLRFPYRGRLAPSPTGLLHIGHARTFHRAWQRSREAGGTLVLRMEDLDRERSRTVFADQALEDLGWLGIDWQEGPDVGGPSVPYEQSRRGELYLAAWERLREGGFLYPCSCSRKDLSAALRAPHEGGRGNDPDEDPVYPGTCRPRAGKKVPGRLSRKGHYPGPDPDPDPDPGPSSLGPSSLGPSSPGPSNWRFRVRDGEVIEFHDANLGPQRFLAGSDFGDFLVFRRDGVASYQLACVVDDAAMGITEVVRGRDLLKSTARQILLNRALGYPDPGWFHTELVVDQQGRRLAKRHDALSIVELRRQGRTPEEILENGSNDRA